MKEENREEVRRLLALVLPATAAVSAFHGRLLSLAGEAVVSDQRITTPMAVNLKLYRPVSSRRMCAVPLALLRR